MKIRNWCRKFSLSLVAAGLLTPAAAHAAGLGVNLVVNGGFENVNLATAGGYNGPLVLDWTGPNLFAYSHDGSASSAGVVPDYADGADPPSAGHWYFTPNNTGVADPTDVHDPNVYYQDVALNSGGTAVAIAAGTATFSLSAFMTSYLNDTDFGNVQVDFRDAASATIGTAKISDTLDAGPNNVWNLTTTNGLVPVGTASARISLYGTRTSGGAGADGYTDNVEFIIRGIPEPSTVALAGIGLAAGIGLRRRRRDC
jgi:hypothetical protein